MARVNKIVKLKVEKSWEEATREYLELRRAQGLRPSTIKNMSDYFHSFISTYPECWSNLKPCLMSWLSQDIKPATYNLRVSYLKGFFQWCVNENILETNPLDGFKKKKTEPKITSLDMDTLQRLLKMPDVMTYAGLRDYALILLTMDTGIRPKEALNINIADVNFISQEIYIRPEVSKTKVSRTLPISKATIQTIQKLLRARHPLWSETAPVFSSADGQVFTTHSWNNRLKMYSKKLGEKITPYDLRHAFALEFLRNGGNALALQRIMGHSDLSMTKWYINFSTQDIHNQHMKASPLNNLLRNERIRNSKLSIQI